VSKLSYWVSLAINLAGDISINSQISQLSVTCACDAVCSCVVVVTLVVVCSLHVVALYHAVYMLCSSCSACRHRWHCTTDRRVFKHVHYLRLVVSAPPTTAIDHCTAHQQLTVASTQHLLTNYIPHTYILHYAPLIGICSGHRQLIAVTCIAEHA